MKRKWEKFLISLLLSITSIICVLPLGISQSVEAAGANIEKVSDPDTSMSYTSYFGEDESTEYEGRIWTDKTVFTENATFHEGNGSSNVTVQNDADFLVAYSAMSSTSTGNLTVSSPLDVVFVVDISGSMVRGPTEKYDGSREYNRLHFVVEALNESIEYLMNANEYNRVAIMTFSSTAGPDPILPLSRYSKSQTTEKYVWIENPDHNYVTDPGEMVRLISDHGYAETNSYKATNIQCGMYEGMKLLLDEKSTFVTVGEGEDEEVVPRIPTTVLFSDGNPTVSSNSESWWEPENNYLNGDGRTANGYSGNGIKAIFTAAYMKQRVSEHYSVQSRVYTIGTCIDVLKEEAIGDGTWNPESANEGAGQAYNLAIATLDPNFALNNQDAAMNNTIMSARQKYIAGFNPVLTVSAGTGYTDGNGAYETPKEYTVTQAPMSFEFNISSMHYSDGYFNAIDADEVLKAFSDAMMEVQYSTGNSPTQIKSSDLTTDGYLVYSDPIGEYMDVKDIKAIIYNGKAYTEKEKKNTENKTQYVFSGNVRTSISGTVSLEKLIIEVERTESGGVVKENVVIKVPAALIPLRINKIKLDEDKRVTENSCTDAVPIRILYTVGLQDGVLNAEGEVTSKVSEEYIESHTDSSTGKVFFNSNLYEGNSCQDYSGASRTAGNANVQFTPARNNPYYRIMSDTTFYLDENFVMLAGINDEKMYYCKSFFEDRNLIKKAVVHEKKHADGMTVSGKSTDVAYAAAGTFTNAFLKSTDEQKSSNITNTAENVWVSQKKSNEILHKIYLGNNGKLMAGEETHSILIRKHVEDESGVGIPEDAEFTVKIKFKDYAGKTIECVKGNEPINLTFDSNDVAEITIKDSEKIEISGLKKGLEFEIKEDTEKNPDGFSFDRVTCTADMGNVNGETVTGVIGTGNPVIDIYNKYLKTGSVTVVKKDNEDNPLEGAGFTVFDSAGKEVESEKKTVLSKRVTFTSSQSGYDAEANRIEVAGKSYIVHKDQSNRLFYYSILSAEERGQYFAGSFSGTVDAVAEFSGLQINEKYTLKETSPPEGYISNQESIDFTLTDISSEKFDVTYTVINRKLELPAAGGDGPGIFALCGLLVFLGAASVLIMRLKQKYHISDISR